MLSTFEENNLLIEAADGILYGTTLASAGSDVSGVLFRVAKNGTGYTVLHTFCLENGCPDGMEPVELANGPDGNVYGVTFAGGSNDYACSFVHGCGTMFQFVPSTQTFQNLTVLDGSMDLPVRWDLPWRRMEISTELSMHSSKRRCFPRPPQVLSRH
ncbi:MAG: choice-of-anchor tandem repeat GloVer-containing protein [Terriglobales bacterium]